MSEERSGKYHWVPVIAAIITASAVVIAAYVGADAKRQVEALKVQKESLERELNSARGDLLSCRKGGVGGSSQQPPRSGQTMPTPGSISGDPSRPEPEPAKGAQVDTGEGITFALNGCYKNGYRVRCELSIKSNEDKEVMLFGESRLIGTDGTELLASKVSLGNEEVGGRLSSVAKDLVRNVPIKASISFEGVDPNAKAVNLIELKCSPVNARFRDVPLQ